MSQQKRPYTSPWPALNPRHLVPSERNGTLPFPFSAPNKCYFYRASYAIYHLFRVLQEKEKGTVLMPDYHSGNEVMAARAAGAPIQFYRIDRQMRPDLDELRRLCKSARVLYAIHYAGWPQPVAEMAEICRENGLMLVEDCALTLLSTVGGKPVGSFGDYSIYCMYKTLPVPNGGLLIQNRNVLAELNHFKTQPCGRFSTSRRAAELLLEWLRMRSDSVGGSLFRFKRAMGRLLSSMDMANAPIGSIGFNPTCANLGIAPLSLRMLHRFDFAAISRRRIENYRELAKMLDGRANIFNESLGDGVVPLFFPFLVSDKRAAARALWRAGISAVEFWNEGDPLVGSGPTDAQFLRSHVLEVPIHQDVGSEQLHHIAREVSRLEKNLNFRASSSYVAAQTDNVD